MFTTHHTDFHTLTPKFFNLSRLEEGRQPWSGGPALPLAELAEHEAAVWAVAAASSGDLLLSGTEVCRFINY